MASTVARTLPAIRKTTSNLFIATTKHSVKGHDSSMPHSASINLMYRAGLISQASSGVYHWLPFGLRVMDKLVDVIDKEMEKIGGAKMLLPSLLIEELWKQSGRWEEIGTELFKLKDRNNKMYCLGPTHEEPITDLVASKVTSHRQLPLRLYQVSVKFRDEERPRYGLLRCKEFWMKDMYSFDTDKEAALTSYNLVREAYRRIFDLLEQPFVEVQAPTGLIGGDLSHEFHVTAPIGEDTVITCPRCNFAINREMKEEQITTKDLCPKGSVWSSCNLKESKAIEVGHTFHLGTKYSKVFQSTFKDHSSNERYCEMGCYGLGISRILSAIIEQSAEYDADRIVWPKAIAPFRVCIIPMSSDANDPLTDKANKLYDYLVSCGLHEDVILEDRFYLSPGKKFKDAELIGYPYLVICGKTSSNEREVEVETYTKNGRTSEILTFDALRDKLLSAQ